MTKEKTQIDKFRDTARELEADESEAAFDAKLRKLVGAPTKEQEAEATKEKK